MTREKAGGQPDTACIEDPARISGLFVVIRAGLPMFMHRRTSGMLTIVVGTLIVAVVLVAWVL